MRRSCSFKRLHHEFASTSIRFCSTMLTAGVSKRFQLIQSQAAAAVVTMDTDMDTSLRDRLVRTHVPDNVEREGGEGRGGGKRLQLHSTFAITKEMLSGY